MSRASPNRLTLGDEVRTQSGVGQIIAFLIREDYERVVIERPCADQGMVSLGMNREIIAFAHVLPDAPAVSREPPAPALDDHGPASTGKGED